MAIATSNQPYRPVGGAGNQQRLDVAASTHIYKGTLVSQLTATGGLCPGSTAGSGRAVAVATHEADNSAGALGDEECMVETDRIFIFANGGGADAFSTASIIGATAYMIDDHTVADNDGAATRQIAGEFRGMDDEGVRILVKPA